MEALVLWFIFVIGGLGGVFFSVVMVSIVTGDMHTDTKLSDRLQSIAMILLGCTPGLFGIVAIVYSAHKLLGML